MALLELLDRSGIAGEVVRVMDLVDPRFPKRAVASPQPPFHPSTVGSVQRYTVSHWPDSPPQRGYAAHLRRSTHWLSVAPPLAQSGQVVGLTGVEGMVAVRCGAATITGEERQALTERGGLARAR